MARYLYVGGGIVRNIVEHPTTPPERSPEGYDIVPDPTGLISIGAVYDVANDLREREYTRLQVDRVILSEIFRLTNEVRVLQGQAVVTQAAFKTRIKGLM